MAEIIDLTRSSNYRTQISSADPRLRALTKAIKSARPHILRKTLYTLCDESPAAARKAASILLVSSDMIRLKRGGRSTVGAGKRKARNDHSGTEQDANRSDDHDDEDLEEKLSEEEDEEDNEEEEEDDDDDEDDEDDEDVDEVGGGVDDDDESNATEEDDGDVDDEDNDEEDKKRNRANGHKGLRSRYSECEKCGKEFDVTQNGKTACNWHNRLLAGPQSAVVCDKCTVYG